MTNVAVIFLFVAVLAAGLVPVLRHAPTRPARKRPQRSGPGRTPRTRHLSNAEMLRRLVTEQDGLCATCNRRRRLVLDHDHASGLVRGALCSTCNGTEGGFVFDARYGPVPSADVFAAYRAAPPAAWRQWRYHERYTDTSRTRQP